MSEKKAEKEKEDPPIQVDLGASAKLDIGASVKLENSKIEKKETIEINPNKIAQGEIGIVQVPEWGGLKTQTFAVAIIDGELVVKHLKEKKPRTVRKKSSFG